MSYEIHRKRIPLYNNTPSLIECKRDYTTRIPALGVATDYTAVIESAVVDLSQAPLDPAPQYEIMVFCDIKEPEPIPDGMVFGPNYYKFPGQLDTVQQFLKWLSDVLVKAPLPYNLGLFELNNDDFFQYSITPTDYAASFTSGKFQVYFNSNLVPIMEGFVDSANPIQAGGQLFYPMTPHSGTTVATVDTMFRLNKIQSIIFETTLPVTKTEFLDLTLNEAVPMGILGTVEVNSFTYNVRTKTDWVYSPTVLRHYTMNQPDQLMQFSINVLLQYQNGAIRRHVLKPGERFTVNLAFFPRTGVDVE